MHRAGSNPRPLLSLLASVALAGGVLLVSGCGSSGSSKQTTAASTASAAKVAYKAEAVLSPATPEPPLKLRNYLGRPVNIDSYRGKALLVTFLYTHCRDICPLITSNLRVAQGLMGPALAAKSQIVGVSVDPRRDTPKAVAGFLARHGMTGRMQYLIGSTAQLARVWRAWGVGSERDAHQPELIEHSGLVYGITASGQQATVYAANFRPADVARDVSLLASR